MITRKLLACALPALACLAVADEQLAESLRNLPVNRWTKLPCKPEPGLVWSALVYVPTRGQVLHWGKDEGAGVVGEKSRNDVRAFDLALGDWVSDYPSDQAAKLAHSGLDGAGAMLPSGRPAPAAGLSGVCYDPRRDQVIYTMYGLMAAYDPKGRTWADLKAKTIMPSPVPEHSPQGGWRPTGAMRTEFSGGPPVYGIGTCYDPVNDEILLFPHFDAKNVSLRDATGQITGHCGTFRYGFRENTWRAVSDTLGSEATGAARQALIAVMAKAGAGMDAAWLLQRRADGPRAAEAAKQMDAAATEAGTLSLPDEAKAAFSTVPGLLRAAAAAIAGGRAGEAVKPARQALWLMNGLLDTALRVEPPPRCAAPMVYDAKNKAIVLFGGHTNLARTDLADGGNVGARDFYNGQNDTWRYDVTTRQWRELPCKTRPPCGQFAARVPMLAYDPESGLVLLVTRSGNIWNTKTPRRVALWTLDVAKGEWSKRDEQEWTGSLTTRSGQGSESPKSQAPAGMFAFDPKNRLLLVVEPAKTGQETYAMRLDLGKLPSEPAPAWTPPPPIVPQEVPQEDDPAWVAKLKALPANTWVPARPAKEPPRRDWGSLGVDPVRGWAVYQGGGHSSYQVNEVSVYAVGANAWVRAAGDHNAYIPPNEWEGTTIGYRGGPRARHERNTYQALDGRVYTYIATTDIHQDGTLHCDPSFVRFYDIDRGGVWRELPIKTIERPPGAPDACNYVHMCDPGGRILTLQFIPSHYYGPNNAKCFFRCYDIYESRFTIREVPKPFPEQRVGESRPFCYLPDRDQILYMGRKPEDPNRAYAEHPDKEKLRQVTWVYDPKTSRFGELAPRHVPPLQPVKVVEYAQSQKCALAIVGKDEQWVYSLERNDWAPLPLASEGDARMGFQGPYGQMVWVAKYGVFVNMVGRTWVMRPDFSQIKWE